MFTTLRKFLLAFFALILLASRPAAGASAQGNVLVRRDMAYEQNLRWEASDDKTVTPAKVLRWLRGARGAAVFTSVSATEFQPIVNVYNSHVRLVAALAYKF